MSSFDQRNKGLQVLSVFRARLLGVACSARAGALSYLLKSYRAKYHPSKVLVLTFGYSMARMMRSFHPGLVREHRPVYGTRNGLCAARRAAGAITPAGGKPPPGADPRAAGTPSAKSTAASKSLPRKAAICRWPRACARSGSGWPRLEITMS